MNQYEKENAQIEKDAARKRLVLKISCVQHYITGAEIHATDVDFDSEKSHEVFYRALFILSNRKSASKCELYQKQADFFRGFFLFNYSK